MPIVIDPNKQVTDPVLLSALASQGVDWRYVELYQDYAPAYDIQGRRIKGRSPYAKFYRHTDTNKQWMVVSQLPMVNADGIKVEVGWVKSGSTYTSKVNQFQAQMSGKTTTITLINDQPTGQKKGNSLTYTPHLFLDGVEVSCGKETLLAVDPINPNYQNNVLEWDYGICKRRLRLIEGKILGTWVFAQNPNGEVRIHYDQSGDFRLHLGQYAISDSEELIPTKEFENPIFGYPFTISDSLTFYPDPHTESVSVDGECRYYSGDVGWPPYLTWAEIHNNAGTGAQDSVVSMAAAIAWENNGYYNLRRAIALFNTSSLPDDCVISAAIISLYGSYKLDEFTGSSYCIGESNPASNTVIAAGDFDSFPGLPTASTVLSNTIAYASISIVAYNDFTLNATGLTKISKTSITKLAFRLASWDMPDTDPAQSGGTKNTAVSVYSAEQGNGYKPKLVVTYTAGTQYQRSGTALLGLLGSGTRGLGLTRSKTGLLGLLPSGTRVNAFSRAGTALLGLKGIASRTLALTRIKTALLGLTTIGSKLKTSQSFFPITPVEVTPGTINSWVDVDVSSYVPAGATGVLLHLVNNWGSSTDMGVRKNGSTDDRHPDLRSYCHCWAAIGVDSNRVFEAYIAAYSPDLQIYLVGYTKAGVTFFTNGYDKSLSSSFSWIDTDCSTECPNAIGLIFEVHPTAQSSFGFRKNGSTDDRVEGVIGHNTHTVIIGCDESQICEAQIGSTDCDFYLIGYITAGAFFYTNATDLSLGTVDTWLDLASLPSDAVMGFIQVFNVPATANNYGLRKNGSAEDIYRKGVYHPWGFVECDSNKLIEGKIEDTLIDFFLVGYARVITGGYYQRIGTALLGLLSTGTRSLALSRSNTALLGLKGVGSRALSLTRLDSALLGLKGIGSKAISRVRAGTGLLGLKATATKSIALTRSQTALLGLKTLGSRTLALTRLDTALLGLTTTGTKLRAYTKAGTALLGLKTTATRSVAYTRTKTALLGLLATGSRTIAITRSKTALLGLKATGIASTMGHYVREGIAYLGLVATGTRSLALTRTKTALLGLKTTGTRVLAFTRVNTALLGLKTTATKGIAMTRAGTALLGLKLTGTRTISIIRVKTALLGLKATGLAVLPSLGKLVVKVITSQYRNITLATSQHRLIKVITSQYRNITLATSQHRLIKVITSQYRKIRAILLGE